MRPVINKFDLFTFDSLLDIVFKQNETIPNNR